MKNDILRAQGFNSDSVESKFSVILSVKIGSQNFENLKFHVFEQLNCDMILPSGIFETIGILNVSHHPEIILNGEHLSAHYNENFLIRALSDISVPPESQKILTLREGIPGLRYIIEPVKIAKNVEFLPTLSEGKILMLVKNFNPFEITLHQGEPLAQVEPDFRVNHLVTVPDSPAEQKRHLAHLKTRIENFSVDRQKIVPNFGNQISEDAKNKISKLFNDYSVNFSLSPNDVGKLKNFRYAVNLRKDAKVPWYQPGRRISEKAVSELSKVFNEELRLGLIDEGASEYYICLLYTSPSPRDGLLSRMPSSA